MHATVPCHNKVEELFTRKRAKKRNLPETQIPVSYVLYQLQSTIRNFCPGYVGFLITSRIRPSFFEKLQKITCPTAHPYTPTLIFYQLRTPSLCWLRKSLVINCNTAECLCNCVPVFNATTLKPITDLRLTTLEKLLHPKISLRFCWAIKKRSKAEMDESQKGYKVITYVDVVLLR